MLSTIMSGVANKNIGRCSSPRKRSVSFSDTSSAILIEPSSQATASSNDVESQRENLLRDIRVARILLAANPNQDIEEDHIPLVLGLEMFLSPHIMKKTDLNRRRHLNLILAQQDRLPEDDLCALSMASSRMARQKAHISAKTYWRTKRRGDELSN